MENKEVRRLALAALEKQYGTLEAVAEATGTNAAHLSQIKNRTRGMGDKVARRIEAKLGKGTGWLDHFAPEGQPAPSPGRRKNECSIFRELESLWDYVPHDTKTEFLARAQREAGPKIKAAAEVWESMKVRGFTDDSRVREVLNKEKNTAK